MRFRTGTAAGQAEKGTVIYEISKIQQDSGACRESGAGGGKPVRLRVRSRRRFRDDFGL